MEELTFREAVDAVLADFRRSIHTAFPVRVVAYYPDQGLVDCEPAMLRELPGNASQPDDYEAIPTLMSLPIAWPRGGGYQMTFPLRVGDWALLVASEQSLLGWRERGDVVDAHPVLNDPHGLNGCFVIPAAGAYPDPMCIKNVNTTDLVIAADDGSAAIRVKPDGSIELEGSATRLGSPDAAQRMVLGNALRAFISAMTFPTSMGPTGVALNLADLERALSVAHRLDR